MIKEPINEMIKQIINTCTPWMKPGEDGLLRFIDPLDGDEISAHYGATHAAVAFIMHGERTGDKELTDIGYKLLSSILQRWNTSMKLPGFHNDFNNFALCVAWDHFARNQKQEKLSKQIKEIILATPDSNNPTVNWFPMRWYVNLKRYQWTGEKKYKAACDKCRLDIKSATYKDGFIDDRLPIGLSFNLQYDVATVAVMQFLRSAGEEIDISVELGALLNVVAPDGDINYLGRGTNQIFAWGLWVYLLVSSGKDCEAQIALEYLKDKVPVMLNNNNIMLNDWPGEEKYMWWDYHYCSVYTAHFLFWLVIALEHVDLYPVTEKINTPEDSGVQVYKDKDYFIVTFGGRKEYLAEKGPCIAALWTRKQGFIFKGPFGPWGDPFGNKYCNYNAVIHNYYGLLELKIKPIQSKKQIINRIKAKFQIKGYENELIKPLFVNIDIETIPEYLMIKYKFTKKSPLIVNIPCFNNGHPIVSVDGINVVCRNVFVLKNQYGWVHVFQSKIDRVVEEITILYKNEAKL